MSKLDFWPFPRQSEYDAFNSAMKGSDREKKETAIRAWIVARAKQTEQGNAKG